MTNNNIKDERIVEQQRKISSDAFRLVSMFLLASMLYKQFILNAPISTYITEFIAFFGSSFYVVLRNVMKGNDTYSIKKPVIKRYLLTSLISSSTLTIVLVLNGYTKYMRNKASIIIVFFCAFVYWFLISWGLNRLSKKRADKIAKQYEDE